MKIWSKRKELRYFTGISVNKPERDQVGDTTSLTENELNKRSHENMGIKIWSPSHERHLVQTVERRQVHARSLGLWNNLSLMVPALMITPLSLSISLIFVDLLQLRTYDLWEFSRVKIILHDWKLIQERSKWRPEENDHWTGRVVYRFKRKRVKQEGIDYWHDQFGVSRGCPISVKQRQLVSFVVSCFVS